MRCTLHDQVYWTKSNHYKSGTVTCKFCQGLQRLGNSDNSRHLEELYDVLPYYTFCPDKLTWSYKCNKCGFIGTKKLDKLKLGQKGCKCSKTYKWTKEDRETQIMDLVKKEPNITSFELIKYRTTLDSELRVTCETHGEYTCTVNNFVNHGSRCPECAKELTSLMFYPLKSQCKDYLYLITLEKDTESFIKVGRSFKPDQRFSVIMRESGYELSDVKILLEDTHEKVHFAELSVLREFELYSYKPKNHFKGSTECMDKSCEGSIKIFIENLK